MTMWAPGLAGRPGPRYRALVEALAQEVADGRLPEGTRLPPQRDLAYRLGVTVGTVSRAYALAAERGLVTGEVGRGTFVRRARRRLSRPRQPGERRRRRLIKLTVKPRRTQLRRARLPSVSPRSRRHPGRLPTCGRMRPSRALLEHRAAAARWIAGVGLDASPERTIITGGAHQAIVVAFAALARPGDTVLAEALTYAGVCHVAERCGVAPARSRLDDEGVLPEALDAAAHRRRPPADRQSDGAQPDHRDHVAGAARGDRGAGPPARPDRDRGRRLRPACRQKRPPPLAALAPSAPSTSAAPPRAWRRGCVLACCTSPEALFERIADAQHDLFLTCPPLMAELFTRLVADGTAERLAGAPASGSRGAAADRPRSSRRARLPGAADQLSPVAAATAALARCRVHRDGGASAGWRSIRRPRSPSTGRARPMRCGVSLSAAAGHDRLRRGLQIVADTLGEMPPRPREVI